MQIFYCHLFYGAITATQTLHYLRINVAYWALITQICNNTSPQKTSPCYHTITTLRTGTHTINLQAISLFGGDAA